MIHIGVQVPCPILCAPPAHDLCRSPCPEFHRIRPPVLCDLKLIMDEHESAFLYNVPTGAMEIRNIVDEEHLAPYELFFLTLELEHHLVGHVSYGIYGLQAPPVLGSWISILTSEPAASFGVIT